MTTIVVTVAAWTPVGAFKGDLSSLSATRLGTVAVEASPARSCVEDGEVSEAIMGQILTAGAGQNPGRYGRRPAGDGGQRVGHQ